MSAPRSIVISQNSKSLINLHFRLTCGCTLLLFGAISDIIGSRIINLIGLFVLSLFILAAGFARTGVQLVASRAFQGVGMAMCFPTSVSILSKTFPHGRIRNIAFGCLGLGTPLGFAIGILVGGWFESTSIGWRPGFYLVAAINAALFAINCYCLPPEQRKGTRIWTRLKSEIDWIGIVISSISMGLLSYSLAYVLSA